MERTIITRPPILLQIMRVVSDVARQIINPSQFELHLTINEVDYFLVGALLYNGSHYRSVTHKEGKFLVYDGIINSRKSRMWWMSTVGNFGKGWTAKKLWYSRDFCDQPSSDHAISSFDNEFSYPDGVTVGPMLQTCLNALNKLCDKCGEEVCARTPSMTIANTGEDGRKVIKHYHFPSCCPLDKRNEISAAINESSYPEEGKNILHSRFEAFQQGTYKFVYFS